MLTELFKTVERACIPAVKPRRICRQELFGLRSPLRPLARDELREVVACELVSRGPGKNGDPLFGWGQRLFCGKSLEEVREIATEIGMLGQHGLDINDPKETHVLRALPRRAFSALGLVCIMYAGFKLIEPGMDIGVDLGEEWGMAERPGRDEMK